MTQIIRKKHPSTIRITQPFIYPIARWSPWGKWSMDGTILMKPNNEQIYPPRAKGK